MGMGRSLKELREARGLTMEELAEKAALSVGFLSRVENGHRDFSNASRQRVAKVLGVGPAALIRIVTEPGNETSLMAVADNEPKTTSESDEKMDRVSIGVLKTLLSNYDLRHVLAMLTQANEQIEAEKRANRPQSG